MITGVLTILLGEGLFFGSKIIFIWALLFFVINSIYFILLEEPDLYQTFGDEYKAYKEEVPRWIPRFRPYTIDKNK
jgi:protein-S-isoprenylcysteine O-methyltransferase Ste14